MSKLSKRQLARNNEMQDEKILDLQRKVYELVESNNKLTESNNKLAETICSTITLVKANKKSIMRIENKDVPALKTLDQSVFNGVDDRWQWAAIEEDGSLYLFAKKPFVDLHKWAAGINEDELFIGGCDATNWQDSLIERKAELTGSDLCRAMLERGDKYVMCYTGWISEEQAISAACIDTIIQPNNAKSQFSFEGITDLYDHAIPIDNSGNPLTAKDVGL